ncbi:AAEL014873-PA [Aedes aegypti]|uniref:AAEL014873-PA n=1 Tax=Aedes aegypti TaxID=7159 RepID=Q16F75_AEDAE|nr:AAEL014873-PA [Aedes aegypti]
MCNRSLVLELLLVVTLASAAVSAASCSWRAAGSNWFGGEICILQKVYDDCQEKSDFTECLKQKALTSLSRAIDMDSIQLVDGVTLVKQNVTDDAVNETVPGLSDARALEGLSSTDRSLIQKLDKFLKSHTVKMDLSTEGRGRGDKNKGSRYIIAAMLTAMGIAGPIGLKTLGAIAFKALVISKVALTIASILALKKIFKSDHHEETSFQVHTGHDNRRNTYVVRPARVPNDPYRYYYEQPAY